MEVPEMAFKSVSLVGHVLMMSSPGAKTSTTDPKLEKEARASAIVVAPTVIAEGARAGLEVAASALSFPAATYIIDVVN